MLEREDVEKVLIHVRRQREQAEAAIESARDRLARIAAGLVPVEELNPDEIEGAADDLAAAVRKLQILDEVAAQIRSVLF